MQGVVPVHMIGETLGRGKVEGGGYPKAMTYQLGWSAAEMALGGNPVGIGG